MVDDVPGILVVMPVLLSGLNVLRDDDRRRD